VLTIDKTRFLNDLYALANIGLLPKEAGGGRDRRAFSEAEREARRLFISLAEESGLAVRTDAAGNLSARHSVDASAKTLLFGSHMDTVPNGGPYDGALGTIAALEALRVLKETQDDLPLSLECIAFTDEEGRYCGLTGSQLYAGTYNREETQRFCHAAMRFPDDVSAMAEILPMPFTVDNVLTSSHPAEEIAAFVELHIEQGPQLEHEGVTIGVVDAIFGLASCQVIFGGRSDHSGTTPMHLRNDALVAASRFITHMNSFVTDECPGAVLTCGDVNVLPGSYNVVPREAIVLVEYRANSTEMLDKIENKLRSYLERTEAKGKASVHMADYHRLEPRPMEPSIQQAIGDSCRDLDYSHMTISSGALHDAHSIAAVAPTGMIFVPSIGGRSHCPEEDTAKADLVAGANVLLNTLVRLIDAYSE